MYRRVAPAAVEDQAGDITDPVTRCERLVISGPELISKNLA
jgi:hypothetical protein